MHVSRSEHVTFRAATAADAPCLSALATRVFLDTYAADGIRPSLAREVIAHLSLPVVSALLETHSGRFIVAERTGHMIAFAQVTLGAMHGLVGGRPAAELNRLYVLERFSGTGVGTALLDRAESRAAESGASVLWLTAWEGNRRALRFYARRGYADVGSTPYVFEGERYENRVFVKPLDGRGGVGSGAPR
jgi:GNAT superfamily N-acetyltransferase